MINTSSGKSEQTSSAPLPLKKKANFQSVVNMAEITMVGILLIVVFMVSLTQLKVDNSAISLKEIGVGGLLLYACTVSIYLLSRSYSMRKGRQTEKYEKAVGKIEENNTQIVSRGFAKFTSKYCREWEQNEIDNTRTNILASAGITLDEFNEKYLKYSEKELKAKRGNLTDFEMEVILAAKSVKRLKFDESYLSVYDKHGRRVSPSGGVKVKTITKVKTVQTFITSAISSVFSVSLVLDIIANPTYATVVMCIVKVVTILIFGVFGMVGGYQLTSVMEVNELKEKADEQLRFIKTCEQYEKDEREVKATVEETCKQNECGNLPMCVACDV